MQHDGFFLSKAALNLSFVLKEDNPIMHCTEFSLFFYKKKKYRILRFTEKYQ